jgi:DNA-binding transcriptional regulator LsrR (DeoR family)
MPAYERIRLITTILNLYYVEKLTQTEIAKRLDLSVPKVNRLLLQARELGYIEFVIRTPFQHLFELENRLKAVFGLQEAIVIPSEGSTGISILNAVGSAAANYLLERIHDGDVIAITPGTTVRAVIQSLDTQRQFQVEIVPLLGSIEGELESDLNYLSIIMGDRLGGKSHKLHAPAFVESRENCEVLLSIEPVKKILDIGRRANIALLGIGSLDPETSRFVQFTSLAPEEMRDIINGCGGAGEIAGFLYNSEGQPCGKEYAERVIGLNLNEIRRIPFRIGVAASAEKALPIYGALRGGYLHVLITDEAAAHGVLDIFAKNFQQIA